MRGKGGGKRWMKCRGNEEIKIGTTEQVSEKEKTLHLFKSTSSNKAISPRIRIISTCF